MFDVRLGKCPLIWSQLGAKVVTMIATETATNFNREPSRILSKAERGQTVLIEKHGRPCAVLIPYPQPTSGDEMARRLSKLQSNQAAHREAAAEVEKLIKDMDDASRKSYGID